MRRLSGFCAGLVGVLVFLQALSIVWGAESAGSSVAASFDDDWVTVSVQGPGCRLDVRTEKKPTAVWVDGTALEAGAWSFSEEGGMASVQVAQGEHEIEIALMPNPERPATEAEIPVKNLDGSGDFGKLKALFGGSGMRAAGVFSGEAGKLEVTVKCAPSGRKNLDASFTAAGNPAWSWALDPAKETEKRDALVLAPEAALELGVTGARLRGNPVLSVEMKRLASFTPLPHSPSAEVAQEGGILIEAEKFSAEGGGPVKISGGKHKGAHGNDNILDFGRPGQWVEWKFQVPKEGKYRLVVVGASDHDLPIRRLDIDGKLPCPECELLQFARTGGWANNDAAQWWAFRIADKAGKDLPFDLTAGEHTVRVTVVMDRHLNLDYLLWLPMAPQ